MHGSISDTKNVIGHCVATVCGKYIKFTGVVTASSELTFQGKGNGGVRCGLCLWDRDPWSAVQSRKLLKLYSTQITPPLPLLDFI